MAKEKFKTMHNVFDEFTNRNLYKLMSEGHFKGLVGQLNMGKESNVFIAEREDGSYVIIKIYRLENCDFNKMYDYLKYDSRYIKLSNKRREVIFAWTQREFRNLLKAREAGVRVPTPYTFKFNILVEEFIGDEGAASKLKDLFPQEPKPFFDDLLKNLMKLAKAGLVHADLSAFNILNFREKPYFIDFSQTTPYDNPNAEEYLKRDIKNICVFFEKHGFKTNPEKIFLSLDKVLQKTR